MREKEKEEGKIWRLALTRDSQLPTPHVFNLIFPNGYSDSSKVPNLPQSEPARITKSWSSPFGVCARPLSPLPSPPQTSSPTHLVILTPNFSMHSTQDLTIKVTVTRMRNSLCIRLSSDLDPVLRTRRSE